MNSISSASSAKGRQLLDSLAKTSNLLIIQDLDGVCMELVADPLTRRINPDYVRAAHCFREHFHVLTNGEHIGSRGVNLIIDRALGDPEIVRQQGLYLPGLAAGGVQHQDNHGQVSHPGVSATELAFLAQVPQKARAFLASLLGRPPYQMAPETINPLLQATILDNPASPTLNLNAACRQLRVSPALYLQLQQDVATFMEQLLAEARAQQLDNAFFIHYAPNLGRHPDGTEQLKPAKNQDAGTTDFQLMLRGAIKEAGVLVILNQYYGQITGVYPLGYQFNVRQAPRSLETLLQLAREAFDPAWMPRILGVGDTLTSSHGSTPGEMRRGGSDRGFMTLIQALGQAFSTANILAWVDSSQGEVRRPGISLDIARTNQQFSINELAGISDQTDPLKLDLVFPGGPQEYVQYFCQLAKQWQYSS